MYDQRNTEKLKMGLNVLYVVFMDFTAHFPFFFFFKNLASLLSFLSWSHLMYLFFTSSCQTLLLSSFQSLHLHLFWRMTLTSFCQRHQVKHVRPFFLPEEYKCEHKAYVNPSFLWFNELLLFSTIKFRQSCNCVSICLLAKYLMTNLMVLMKRTK